MSNQTETFVVTEGTDTLDGKPVKKGDRLAMSPTAALYHQGLGRLVTAPVKRASPSKGESPVQKDDEG